MFLKAATVLILSALSLLYLPTYADEVKFYETSDCRGSRTTIITTVGQCRNIPNSPDGKFWINSSIDLNPQSGHCFYLYENSDCSLRVTSRPQIRTPISRPNCRSIYDMGYYQVKSIKEVLCQESAQVVIED